MLNLMLPRLRFGFDLQWYSALSASKHRCHSVNKSARLKYCARNIRSQCRFVQVSCRYANGTGMTLAKLGWSRGQNAT